MKKATAVFLVLMILLSGCAQTTQESQDIETSNNSTGTIDGTDDPFSNGTENPADGTVPNEQTTAPDTTQPSGSTTQITTPSTQPSTSTTPTDPTPYGALYIDLTAQKSNASYKTVVIKNNCFTITEGGTYRVYGTVQNGRIVVDTSKDAKVDLVFDGASVTRSNYAPLYVKQADKVTINLANGTQNILENGGSFAALDENNVDAALFSKDDITITGSGSLSIKSPGGHGITGKDDLTIKGGTITVNASRHALEANDSITISGGTLSLTAGEDGIHTENDEDSTLGIYTQNGGTVTVYATDDAVHAVASLTISSGSLKIEKCFEGLEAAKIYIKGGNVYVNAADDGINATAGADINCYNGEAIISISGGKTEIITQGDALDSNGDLFLSGGEVVCHGPGNTVHGYGTLDFVNKAIVTGGRLIAFTSRGKAFSEDSTQAAFNLNLASMKVKGTPVTVTDANGNVLFSDIAETGFNCVIVSSPELTVGSRYTVTVGNTSLEVYQRNLITKANDK